MKELKVLVFSAAFGNGHLRAAEAVIEELHRQEPSALVTHLDFGDFLSKRFNNMAKKLYIDLVKYVPKLWGKFYYQTAKMRPASSVQRFLSQLGREDFLRCIREFEPDIIVCTHPTVSSIMAQLRAERILQVPVVTIITDYLVHGHWIHPGVDSYIVASEETKKMLVAEGIAAQKIQATGIPVSPKFEKKLEHRQVRAELGLNPDQPVFLIMGGHGNAESTKRVCQKLAASPDPVQIIVVCGLNKALYNSLQEIAAPVSGVSNPMILLGYVDNVEELMLAADLIVTKAGGLTVTEALTMHLPLIIYKPIPGQEEENANFVQNVGAGQVADLEEELLGLLNYYIRHPKEIRKMRTKAASALPGHSAEQTVQNMLEMALGVRTERRIG